jgi:hypothetical protein
MKKINKKSIKSISGFLIVVSILILFFGVTTLFMDSSVFVGKKLGIYDFLFNFKETAYFTSEYEYQKALSLRLYSFFIPLFILIVSSLVYLLNIKKGKTDNRKAAILAILSSFCAGHIGIPLLFTMLLFVVFYLLAKKYKISKKIYKLHIDGNFNSYLLKKNLPSVTKYMDEVVLNKYKNLKHYKDFKIKYEEKNKTEKEWLFNSLINKIFVLKLCIFSLIFHFLFIAFILSMSGNIQGANNNLLNNNVTTLLGNVSISNTCFNENVKYTIYNLSLEKCYHSKFDEKITNTKMLFISLIDKNGGLLEVNNMMLLFKAVVDYKDEDVIYVFRKAYEGLVEKNKKFKSQKHFNENNKIHLVGDSLIKNEKYFYDLSFKLSNNEFVELIKDNYKRNNINQERLLSKGKDIKENKEKIKISIIIGGIFSIKEEEKENKSLTPITMKEIYELESVFKNYNNPIKENNIHKHLYTSIFIDYKKILNNFMMKID